MTRLSLLVAICFIGILACTPKTTEPITETPTTPTPPPVDETLSPCPKFSDTPNSDIEDNYHIYRDFLRSGDWDKAYELWQTVYEVAPAAYGKQNTVYRDGLRFMEHYMAQTTDPAEKLKYRDRIFNIYDQIEECYPEGGYVAGRKAFDYYYKYKDLKDTMEIYKLFKTSIDKDGMKTRDFVVNPFTSLLVSQTISGKIPQAEAKKYAELIPKLIENGLANCKGSGCERWRIVEGYAPLRLEALESIKGFYPCEHYVEKYWPEYEAAPTDCEVITLVGSQLRFGGCDINGDRLQTLANAYKNSCGVTPPPVTICYNTLRDGKYREAVTCFEGLINDTDDNEKKAKYNLLIAKIQHAHLKNFPRARQYALKAADLRPNWGDPYLLIGRLYASSGPLCGPGRGWDSQVVVWPAIDMWNKAKSVDSNATAEANKWINRYSQYMPSYADVFQRNLQRGQTYKVGCWIQRSTKIRTAD